MKWDKLCLNLNNPGNQHKFPNQQDFYSSNYLNKEDVMENKEDQIYERKNVFYKTLLRDFRKFLLKDFEKFIKNSLNNFPRPFAKIFFPPKYKLAFESVDLEQMMNEELIDKSTPYCMLGKAIRVKIYISLLDNYCAYLIQNEFFNIDEYKSQNILPSFNYSSLKTEEELIENEIIGGKEKLMVILGSIIFYKDFKQTIWGQKNLSKLQGFQNFAMDFEVQHGLKFENREEEKELVINAEVINRIFMVFSQKVKVIPFNSLTFSTNLSAL